MPYDPQAALRRLDVKLDQLRGKSYLSGEIIDLLDAVAHRQLDARAEARATLPDDLALASPEAVLQGAPLVARERFPFDAAQAEALLPKMIALLRERGGPLGDGAAAVARALESGALRPAELFERFLRDDHAFFAPWAERMPEAPKTLSFLAFAAMAPSIEAAAERLAEKLPPMEAPVSGACPICGGLPLISVLEPPNGVRRATCSFCRHEYRIKRVACPVCGEEDQRKLTYFTVDEEPGFRVDVCDTCKTYLKTMDLRQLDRIAMPVLDDLDSLALDYVAAGQGYKRATLSAWGF